MEDPHAPQHAARAGGKRRLLLTRVGRQVAERMPAGGFLRHAFAVSSGVAIAQAITVLASPIITRVYPPSVFGTVAALGSVSAIIAIVVSLRFEVAIPIAKDDDEAFSTTALALASATLLTAVAAVLLFLLPPDWLGVAGISGDVMDLRWLVPILVITSVYQTTIIQFGTYRRAYRALASSQIVQAVASSGAKIAIGLVSPTVAGLVIGELIRRTLGMGVVVRESGLHLRRLVGHMAPRRLRAAAYSHRRYPAFVLPSALLNTVSLQAPVIILASRFSTVEAGLYSLGLTAVQMPLSLVQSGVSSAFISRIREFDDAERLPDVMTRMVQALAVVSAPWFAVCAVWGPELMAIAFGEEWREGGTYLALLTPWLFVGFVFSACGMVLWARDRQGADFGWQVAFVVTRLGALILGSNSGSAVVAVAAYAAVSLVVLTAFNVWLLRYAKVGLAGSLLFSFRELAGYLVMLAVIRVALAQVGITADIVSLALSGIAVGVAALVRFRARGVFAGVGGV